MVIVRGRKVDPSLSDHQIGSDNADKWFLYLTYSELGKSGHADLGNWSKSLSELTRRHGFLPSLGETAAIE